MYDEIIVVASLIFGFGIVGIGLIQTLYKDKKEKIIKNAKRKEREKDASSR